jgi:hypothetical protein
MCDVYRPGLLEPAPATLTSYLLLDCNLTMRHFSQEATGIYDINEIVNKFLEAEEQNFSLFNYGTSHTVLCASHAGICDGSCCVRGANALFCVLDDNSIASVM